MITKIKSFFKRVLNNIPRIVGIIEDDIKKEVLHDIADVKAKAHTIIASIENDLLKDIALIESKMNKIISDSNSTAINVESEIKKAIQQYVSQLSTIEKKPEVEKPSTQVS